MQKGTIKSHIKCSAKTSIWVIGAKMFIDLFFGNSAFNALDLTLILLIYFLITSPFITAGFFFAYKYNDRFKNKFLNNLFLLTIPAIGALILPFYLFWLGTMQQDGWYKFIAIIFTLFSLMFYIDNEFCMMANLKKFKK